MNVKNDELWPSNEERSTPQINVVVVGEKEHANISQYHIKEIDNYHLNNRQYLS